MTRKVEVNKRGREKQRQRFEDTMILSLKMGGGATSRNMGGSLQARKDKQRDSYLEPLGGIQPH